MPDPAGYIAELADSKAIIEQNLPGYTCTSFYQPGDWTGEAWLNSFARLDGPIGQTLRACYERSQAYLGGGWCVGPVYYKYGMTYSLALDYDNPSVEQTMSALDIVADTPGMVFVASCHGVAETAGNPTEVEAEVMKAFIDRIAELRDTGQVRLMSLRDAYNACFSPDLNRLADPSFERCDPELMKVHGPWRLSGGAYVGETSAKEGQRYVTLPTSANTTQNCIVQPGRYRLTWWQRTMQAPNGQGVHVYVRNFSTTLSEHQVLGLLSVNSNREIWEQQSALLAICEQMPCADVTFSIYGTPTMDIDCVSLVPEPLNPQLSCCGPAVEVHPETVTLSWNTPPDNVDTVQIRIGTRAYPATTQDGILLMQTPAAPGTRQQVSAPINWTQQTPSAFFSIFALNGDACAPAEIATVCVDRNPPSTPVVCIETVPDVGISASWESTAPQSAIERYRYAVGSSPGADDVVHWTTTDQSDALLSELPHVTRLHVSVQAQNVFGYWSSVGSIEFQQDSGIPEIVELPDGAVVRMNGVVTAVFDNCCYVQQPGVPRGLKIRSAAQYAEGEEIAITGTLATECGERVLIAR